MRYKYIWIVLLLIEALAFCSCKTSEYISGEYVNQQFPSECIDIDPSGLQTVKAWGHGINKKSAINQAMRNVLSEIIFDGLQNGDCDKRPLLNIVNAREKYDLYFKKFFAEDGIYNSFIRQIDKGSSCIKSEKSTIELWSVTCVVDRKSLKQYFIKNNLIEE